MTAGQMIAVAAVAVLALAPAGAFAQAPTPHGPGATGAPMEHRAASPPLYRGRMRTCSPACRSSCADSSQAIPG